MENSKPTIGVLALQGAFEEHRQHLRKVGTADQFNVILVRTPEQLLSCTGLIIPGGESTTMALVAKESHLLEPLRQFVSGGGPTWGTCAGMILLAVEADRTKKGGQELIGGLDIRVVRNQYGRQIESFESALDVQAFASLTTTSQDSARPFPGIFIRAPILQKLIYNLKSELVESTVPDSIEVAPIKAKNTVRELTGQGAEALTIAAVDLDSKRPPFEILARLDKPLLDADSAADSEIVALRQGNVMATSFHPELTTDSRFHQYFVEKIVKPYLASTITPAH